MQKSNVTRKDLWGAVILIVFANWATVVWDYVTVAKPQMMAIQNQITALNNSAQRMQEAMRALDATQKHGEAKDGCGKTN